MAARKKATEWLVYYTKPDGKSFVLHEWSERPALTSAEGYAELGYTNVRVIVIETVERTVREFPPRHD